MAKGENIFRRRDGRWEARYIKGRELSGKIKYGYCYGKTYREAKVKAAKHKAALENGALLPTANAKTVLQLLSGMATYKEMHGERIDVY